MSTINEILKTGILITKINDTEWMVKAVKKDKREYAAYAIFTKQQQEFIDDTTKIIDELGEVALTATNHNFYNLTPKMASIVLKKGGFSSYKKRQDRNRIYFFKS